MCLRCLFSICMCLPEAYKLLSLSAIAVFLAIDSPKKSVRSVSVNPKMLVRAKSIRHPAKATLTVIPEMPINDEVLRSIPSFCFPGETYMSLYYGMSDEFSKCNTFRNDML